MIVGFVLLLHEPLVSCWDKEGVRQNRTNGQENKMSVCSDSSCESKQGDFLDGVWFECVGDAHIFWSAEWLTGSVVLLVRRLQLSVSHWETEETLLRKNCLCWVGLWRFSVWTSEITMSSGSGSHTESYRHVFHVCVSLPPPLLSCWAAMMVCGWRLLLRVCSHNLSHVCVSAGR